MDFYMYHGRTDPEGKPQSERKENGTTTYHDVEDDWGFDGPRLTGAIGFHCTYGIGGEWNLYFESDSAAFAASKLTGWSMVGDDSLTVRFSENNELVRIKDPASGKFHYFGDWGIK